jgi:hypothetical protein
VKDSGNGKSEAKRKKGGGSVEGNSEVRRKKEESDDSKQFVGSESARFDSPS